MRKCLHLILILQEIKFWALILGEERINQLASFSYRFIFVPLFCLDYRKHLHWVDLLDVKEYSK